MAVNNEKPSLDEFLRGFNEGYRMGYEDCKNKISSERRAEIDEAVMKVPHMQLCNVYPYNLIAASLGPDIPIEKLEDYSISDIRQLIESFNTKVQKIISMRYCDNSDIEEIAHFVCMTPERVSHYITKVSRRIHHRILADIKEKDNVEKEA